MSLSKANAKPISLLWYYICQVTCLTSNARVMRVLYIMLFPGAARCHSLLQDIQPAITIVEEAAEVLEAHIVTSLTPGCQHLILIGDHQQLRPNPTVYDLQLNYDLDVSLFERMVTNGMLFSRLSLQHRMRPQIAKMLDHIYVEPKLQNHESVLNFEDIKGVERNLFFVDHNKGEVIIYN